jgi:hypothetical protein
MIAKKTFTNDDLNGSYQLTWMHSLANSDVVPSWKDNLGIFRTIGDLFQVIDDNNVILSCNSAIEGTHTLYLTYEAAGTTTAGRRLFELTETTDPSTTLKIALGKASTPASNITLSNFLTWLYNTLGFLKITSNLSDINNAGTARGNLGVYSTTQVDEGLAAKASLYQAGSGAVLGVNNTSVYKPSTNYNPATLRNIKNLGFQLLLAARIDSGGGWNTTYFLNTNELDLDDLASERFETGAYRITHNFGNTGYFILANYLGHSGDTYPYYFGGVYKTSNNFNIYFADDASKNNADFEFYMFKINPYTAD